MHTLNITSKLVSETRFIFKLNTTKNSIKSTQLQYERAMSEQCKFLLRNTVQDFAVHFHFTFKIMKMFWKSNLHEIYKAVVSSEGKWKSAIVSDKLWRMLQIITVWQTLLGV